ncbi:MAG: hypothetical protein II503_05300, partial [Clostridia bacterium]|nr:hypothetical protein [Clostridia bacterium]
NIASFIDDGDDFFLVDAFLSGACEMWREPNDATMPLVTDEQKASNALLEVAIHFEEGCKKYGERNWQKGIPLHSFIDSAIRHYLKFQRGDDDERHDRAFLWNILCAMWTVQNKPELDDIPHQTEDATQESEEQVSVFDLLRLSKEAKDALVEAGIRSFADLWLVDKEKFYNIVDDTEDGNSVGFRYGDEIVSAMHKAGYLMKWEREDEE